MTNNDLQSPRQKTKDCATRTQLKTGTELRCSGMDWCSCTTSNALLLLYIRKILYFIGMRRFTNKQWKSSLKIIMVTCLLTTKTPIIFIEMCFHKFWIWKTIYIHLILYSVSPIVILTDRSIQGHPIYKHFEPALEYNNKLIPLTC